MAGDNRVSFLHFLSCSWENAKRAVGGEGELAKKGEKAGLLLQEHERLAITGSTNDSSF